LLSDQEIITMLIVGEFLGIDGDKNIFEYFKANWHSYFTGLGDRTTFTKQASKLWYWINRLQQKFAEELGSFSDQIHITDGFPVPVCGFKRAYFSKSFKSEAAYGFCAAKNQKYFGFKGHLIINSSGVISNFAFAAANIDERDVLPENIDDLTGLMLGDKGLIRPQLSEYLAKNGIQLVHPLRSNMQETRDPAYINAIMNQRRLIETVIGQLTERFNIEKVRARTTWNLGIRFMRKILSHTVGMFINKILGRNLLQFEGLVG
jgi:Transposase DDE domain